MKILHSGTFDSNAGGPAMSTYLTMKGLRDRGVEAGDDVAGLVFG